MINKDPHRDAGSSRRVVEHEAINVETLPFARKFSVIEYGRLNHLLYFAQHVQMLIIPLFSFPEYVLGNVSNSLHYCTLGYKKRVVLNMTYRDVVIDDAFINRVKLEAEIQHIDEVMLILGDGQYGVGRIIRVK